MKSAQYLKKVQRMYEEDGVRPGDPDFDWNDAHHPTPRCEKGTETVPLIEGHHFIHDLYQSEDWGRCCFFSGNVKRFLYGEGFLCENWFDLCELYEKWTSVQSRKNGTKSVELGIGIHDPSNRGNVLEGGSRGRKAEAVMGVGIHAPGVSSEAGKKSVAMGVGIHDPANKDRVLEGNRKGGEAAKEAGAGFHAPGVAKEGGRRAVELGVGVHNPKNRQRCLEGSRAAAKVTTSQKWGCLVTGHVSNPGGLTCHQRKREIGTHLRCRLDGVTLVSQTMLLGLASL
jgi:hypothetical protein